MKDFLFVNFGLFFGIITVNINNFVNMLIHFSHWVGSIVGYTGLSTINQCE